MLLVWYCGKSHLGSGSNHLGNGIKILGKGRINELIKMDYLSLSIFRKGLNFLREIPSWVLSAMST